MTYEELMNKYWFDIDSFFKDPRVDFIGINMRDGIDIWETSWKNEHIDIMIARLSRDRYESHKNVRETDLYKAVYGG